MKRYLFAVVASAAIPVLFLAGLIFFGVCWLWRKFIFVR